MNPSECVLLSSRLDGTVTDESTRRGTTSPYKGYNGYSGVGPAPTYGGGKYYAGGSSVPYTAGRASPGGHISPLYLGAAALIFWPHAYYPHGGYMYDYPNDYTFYNTTVNENQTRPVMCGCAKYEACGCDNVTDSDTLKELVGNGSYAALNKSVINVADYKGKMTLLLNGTLPNDTIAASESGAAGFQSPLHALGYWPAAAAVLAAVFLA